jgi:hypothetical protein
MQELVVVTIIAAHVTYIVVKIGERGEKRRAGKGEGKKQF